MASPVGLGAIGERARSVLDARHQAREQLLPRSREIIRACSNAIRAGHRDDLAAAEASLAEAGEALRWVRRALATHPELHGAGYVHDCQKEYTEAAVFLALISGRELPEPESLGVDYPAYLNGLGEAVGELRRRVLDFMRHRPLAEAEALLETMDEIYHLLASLDYPDALTGGLRRTTDAVRGIIEKTRGELTVALRQDALGAVIQQALARMDGGPGEVADGSAGTGETGGGTT
jgi:translin